MTNEEEIIIDSEETNEVEETEEAEADEVETTEERVETPKETPQAKVARLKRQLEQAEKKAGTRTEVRKDTTAKAGELDETQLDYLDLKGVTESEDIQVIEGVVKKTGMTVRQALKDEYVQAKLTANKASRDVKSATPSATRRGGNQSGDISSAIAKFEQTGELPSDFALRTAVVNATVDKSGSNKPSWHR